MGKGSDGAKAGVTAVTGSSQISCDLHSWFLGQIKLLPVLQGLLVFFRAHMLKPYSFKVSAGSSLTPCSEHRSTGWLDNSRQRALKAPCQKLLGSKRS